LQQERNRPPPAEIAAAEAAASGIREIAERIESIAARIETT
jgi:hypothetical protein